MKKDHQSIQKRQNRILELLEERQVLSVQELTELLSVSFMTVRRDLQILEEAGLLVRFHGGARALQASEAQADSTVGICRNLISRYAGSLVCEGQTLLINGSLTAIEILPHIQKIEVTVLTNNVAVVAYQNLKNISIVLTGGALRDNILMGDIALRSVLDYQADAAFLGCSGISQNGEIQSTIPGEIAINESMINHADMYYVLADHTKIGKSMTNASFFLETPGTVITDYLASQEVIKKLCARGMKVVVVNEDGSTQTYTE
jgi:DeoR/GlpR family transcriptional regulator of sugar metabolism